jgi:hypothetical protein
MDKLTILKRARDIIAKQEALAKGNFYRRERLPNGRMTRSGCACAVGAIGLATFPSAAKSVASADAAGKKEGVDAIKAVANAMGLNTGDRLTSDIMIDIFIVNDQSTKEDVVAAFDRAIRLEESA